MIVIGDKIAWMDVPKTGTTSIRKFLRANRIRFRSVGQHVPLDNPAEWPVAAVSVRHPALWMRSWWTYRRDTGWSWMRHRWTEYELVARFGGNLRSWEGWLDAVTSRENWVHDHFLWFTAQTRRDAVRIKCGDGMVEDFQRLLTESGFELRGGLTDFRENASKEKPELTADDLHRIFEANRGLYEKLQYDEVPRPDDR